LPWRIGEITIRNVVNIDESLVQFDQFKLNIVDEIKGFYPNQLFMNHMIYVVYSISFPHIFLFVEEEGNSQNHRVLFFEKKQDDIETVVSTIDKHRQQGKFVNDKSTLSSNVSKKISLPIFSQNISHIRIEEELF
jgi:hypothetical protein